MGEGNRHISPQVSVCLASYNGEKYIKQQLSSILSQIGKFDEVVVSDNYSNDSTVELIKSFNDPRIKIFMCEKLDIVSNFENSLRHCSGELIFLSDQDDFWLENKVSLFKKYLQFFDVVLSDCVVVDSNLNVIANSFFEINKSKSGFYRNIVRNSYIGSSMAFRRDIFRHVLPFPRNIPMHDWWIGLVGEMFYKVYFINTPLTLYRRHESNASQTAMRSKRSLLLKLNSRVGMAFYLLKLVCCHYKNKIAPR